MNIKQIIFDSPLYRRWPRKVEIEEEQIVTEYNLDNLISGFNEKVERYCTQCETNRVFAADRYIVDEGPIASPHFRSRIVDKPSYFKTFRCSKDKNHKIFSGFIVDGDEVIKISEYPSKYDSIKDTFNKYEKVLEKNKITELAKASQLESFGYAICGFLYYRRIFERIIYKTYQDSEIENKIPDEEYRYLKMDEKIKYVSKYLPDYFTENSHIYGVLSKGIHELEEEECQKYLPTVRTIIFFALDEAVAKRNNELRKAEMTKKLNEIRSKLNK